MFIYSCSTNQKWILIQQNISMTMTLNIPFTYSAIYSGFVGVHIRTYSPKCQQWGKKEHDAFLCECPLLAWLCTLPQQSVAYVGYMSLQHGSSLHHLSQPYAIYYLLIALVTALAIYSQEPAASLRQDLRCNAKVSRLNKPSHNTERRYYAD